MDKMDSRRKYSLHAPKWLFRQTSKVYANEEQEGESFSVQYHVAGLDELEQWHLKYAAEFQSNFRSKFGEEVIFFATVLEIMDL